MKCSWFRSCSVVLAVSVTIAAALIPKIASAQLPTPEALTIGKVKGWELLLDGRVSAFASFSHGPPPPKGYAIWQGFEDRPDSSGNATSTRIRSGFVSNYMGWTVRKDVGNDTTLSTRFALWTNISQKRDKTLEPDVDFREVYLKVDAPWGSVLAGRALGLFGRGGIDLDYDIEHGYGLGSPCLIVNLEPSKGPIAACGHVGFGILFPGFNAQLTYATPNFSGFQASVGLFDPAAVTASNYTRTPLPRVEAELAYKAPKYFHASVSGSWQKLGNQDPPNYVTVDSVGVAGALGLTFGPLQLGGAGFAGKGLGIWAALEDYPAFSSPAPATPGGLGYIIRAQKGVLGMAALNFGHTKIAGGVGKTLISKVVGEPAVFAPNEGINFPKSQFGVSAGIYQGLLDNLVLGVDFFSATTAWNDAESPDNAAIVQSPKQTMNFFNVGATVVF